MHRTQDVIARELRRAKLWLVILLLKAHDGYMCVASVVRNIYMWIILKMVATVQAGTVDAPVYAFFNDCDDNLTMTLGAYLLTQRAPHSCRDLREFLQDRGRPTHKLSVLEINRAECRKSVLDLDAEREVISDKRLPFGEINLSTIPKTPMVIQ